MKISVTKNGNFIEERIYAAKNIGQKQAAWSFLIGRSSECEIVIDDRKVSREHVKITCDKGIWVIEKISDIGDVVVNGNNIEKKDLSHGDMISLGSYVLNISFDKSDEKNSPTSFISQPQNTVEEKKIKEKKVSKKTSHENFKQETSIKDKIEEDREYTAELETLSDLQKVEEQPVTQPHDDKKESTPNEDNPFGTIGTEDTFNLTEDSPPDVDQSYTNGQSSDKTEIAKSFSKFILKLFGENAPYEKYILDQNEVKIGRSAQHCQIVLNDVEVSAEHAIIRKTKNTYVLEDLKSANGTILNGIRINQSELANDDEFLIGGTTFTVRIISTFLQDQKDRLMPVEDNQVVEVEEIVEVSADFVDGSVTGITGEEVASLPSSNNKSLFTKDALKDPVKRKKLLIGLIIILGLWILLSEGDGTKTSKARNKDSKKKNYLLEKDKTVFTKDKKEIKLTPEQQESAEALYELSKTLLDDGKYKESLQELDKLHQIITPWKNSTQIYSWAQGGLKRLEEEEKKKQEEIERKIRKQKVKELVKQAQEAVKERHVEVAETLFSEIMKLEPENYDVTYMKATLEAWKKEEEKKRLEEEQKKAERTRNIRLLRPGKQYYLKKEWHKAITALEKFLSITDMDDDLVKEAHSMLTDSRKNLREIIEPLLGKARSLKEGQDLKASYETYLQLLRLVPDNLEGQKRCIGRL
jgi:pSer/pThr/pTyr-binding forkhead associated (FHA) protein